MHESWFGGLEIWLVIGWLATIGIRCWVYKQPVYGGHGLPRRDHAAADLSTAPAGTPAPQRLAA